MGIETKIYELRKKAGLSQEELGFKLNVTRQTVSKWECIYFLLWTKIRVLGFI